MIIRLLVLLTFFVQLSFSTDSINIAIYSKPFLKYVGSQPPSISDPTKPDTNRTNPKNLVDGSFFNLVEFPPKPSSNIGSYLGIEMPDSFAIERLRFVNLFNTATSYRTRIRECQLFAANIDTSTWIPITGKISNPDTTKSYLEIADFDKTKKWKYLKVVLTHQDNAQSTVISEFQVYISTDSIKGIKSITVSPTQYINGESINTINWETINLAPDEKINIYYKPSSSEVFQPLGLNENNDGSFSWNTTLVMDGVYTIRIEPALTGNTLELSLNMNVKNYTNAKLIYKEIEQHGQYNMSSLYSSAYVGDSITLNWSFLTNIKKYLSYHLSYSLDSGKNWISIIAINDSSKRNYTWKIPMMNKSGMYAFFANDFYIDTTRVARLVSPIPHIILGGMDGASFPWLSRSHDGLGSTSGNIASFKLKNSNQNVLMLGRTWMVHSNGDSSSNIFWNSNKKVGPIAVSDLNNDGTTEIISQTIISETGEILSYDTTNTFGSEPVVIDVDNNGIKEIIYHKTNSFSIVSNTGKLLRTITVPSLPSNNINITAVADMNEDGQKDYIFASIGGNSIYCFNQSGIGLNGYPIVIGDIIRSTPLTADLFNTGEPNIIVPSQNNIYCFGKNGNLLSGFPYTFPFNVNPKSVSIADIDNDGFLDIIFTTIYGNSLTRIFCINRFGENIEGWPVTITDSFLHFILESYGDPNIFFPNPVTINGNISNPYIVSIDGDWNNEIIFFSTNGYMYVFDRFGKQKNGFPQFVGAYNTVGAHFGDFDNNGSLNAIIPINYRYVLYLANMDFGPGSYNPSRMPWPTDRQNVERTGIAPQAIPVNVKEEKGIIPERYSLSQNYPNPFNPATSIQFSLTASALTTLKVYDILGREVASLANETIEAGVHVRNFNATNLNSGLYFYTLRSGNFTETKKMMLLK